MDAAEPTPDLPGPLRSLWLATVGAVPLFVPGLLWALGYDGAESVRLEEREPAPWPAWPAEPPARRDWPAKFERWFGDHLPLRDRLIGLHSAVLWYGLHSSATERMTRGHDHWLFYLGDGNEHLHRGVLLEPQELEAWLTVYEDWSEWCRAREARTLFVLAPEKQYVYPEFLPRWAQVAPPRNRTDQFVDGLRARGVEIVDTRPALLAAKERGLVYYPLGTHWNDFGAFVAYGELMPKLTEWFPGLVPLRLADFEIVEPRTIAPEWTGDDWTLRMHLGDLVDQESPLLVYRHQVAWQPVDHWPSRSGGLDGVVLQAEPRLPRAVLLRDSFGEWLWPYLAHHFRRLVSESYERLDVELVERERPDLVLTVRVERLLGVPRTTLAASAEELAAARAWNRSEPLPQSDDGSFGVADGPQPSETVSLWCRAERELPPVRGPDRPAERRMAELVAGDGERTAVEFEFGADRRWAFRGPLAARLPVRLEWSGGDPPQVSLRRAPGGSQAAAGPPR
jgi:hypothetical protein